MEALVNLQPDSWGTRIFGGWSLFTYLAFFLGGYLLALNPAALGSFERYRVSTLLLGMGTTFIYMLLAMLPLVFGLLGSTFSTVYPPSGGVVHELIAFGNPALFWLAIGMYVVGGIVDFVGYFGALIKMAQLEQWIWFILLLVFSGITMLVYIFVGPETHARPLPLFYAYSG